MEVGEVSASKMVRSPRNAGSRVVLVTKNGKKKHVCPRQKGMKKGTYVPTISITLVAN
jgi:hypothetical protein